MKKRIAPLVYPEFSLQEVTNLMYLFRWKFDTVTDVIYTEREPVISEEGISVIPQKTCGEFRVQEYDCLILPGCSDWGVALRNAKMCAFLRSFQGNSEFPIGAICAGPLFLAQAGLLRGKKYTDSLFVEIREHFCFMEEENFFASPVVEDGNVITAVGSAFNDFAVRMARKLGYACPDKILSGYADHYEEQDYYAHLPEDALREFQAEFPEFWK